MEEGAVVADDSKLGSSGSPVAKGSWLAPYSFKPGQSGNPLGGKLPAHTLAAYVRSKTGEGQAIIDFLLAVIAGTDDKFKKVADKLFAAKLLLERGWGQPQQVIQFTQDPNSKPVFDLSKLSDEKFQSAKKLLEILSEAVAEPEKAENPSPDQPGTTILPPSDPKQGD